MALEPSFSAEVFRRAAARPDCSPRLSRAADAVREGKFTWEDVAAGTCEHPLALALFAPQAKEKVWPVLAAIEAELADEQLPEAPPPPPRPRRTPVADEDFSDVTYLEDLAEPPSHPAWPRRPR
ncbi:hypothetical protein [Amycolatopsis regifaucium]|uniref:Uncharacterized protein n=1 Tax=Amycolatopsis regifaucium TaxID=546365 RepID=A0A154M4H8_9PSEU|nr:hypothetical protein [Amycolatopsis regifaucium]KZB79267.1 hypothetical protein AVL48_16875 [Amycolatopsis regifaucium]OKA07449.1 hypothetical protein ATP06_0216560 [Amycolatopsis regifaucium]SFH11184.1 hypothetical protein SAMN04489731_102502 [Amycolatopsis regifaucium]